MGNTDKRRNRAFLTLLAGCFHGAEVEGAGLADALTEAARSQLDHFALMADLAGVDLLVSDAASGMFLACNDSAYTRLGYSKAELLALSPEALQADPDHDAAWVAARRRDLIDAGGGSFFTKHRCKDNTILDVHVSHRVLTIDGHQLLLSSLRERSEAQARETNLAEALHLLTDTEALSGIGGWEVRFFDGRMRWSPQMQRLCRCEANGGFVSLWTYGSLIHPDDRSRWRQEFQRAVNRGDPFSSLHRLLLSDGSEILVHAEAQIHYDNKGDPVRAIGTLRDVTEEQALKDGLALERNQDPLTGLPNKPATIKELDTRLKGRSYNTSLAVLSLDIDGFQEINDTYGSAVGDQVLQALARRLRDLLGPQAWLARIASDEFLILLDEEINSLGDGLRACRTLQERWAQQRRLLNNLPLVPTFSLGLASYPEHGQDSQQLIQCANTALTKAKNQGRIQVCTYSSTISRQIQERMHLGSELVQAIDRQQFRLVVQSQVDGDSTLVGGEMLLRWRNRLGVCVPPSYFIPLAEESGLILQLGQWVFQQTIQQLAHWRGMGLTVPRLALNISPRELELPGRQFIASLLDGLAAHNLSPEQFELEVTETALLRNPLASREQLRVLADQGFRIAIDDFGTGYSSLELLRTLPVHRLKIDRTFVQNLDASSEDRTIVQATITLAHGLGMECIAEGVETDSQRQILADLGCDLYQGYLCGRPLELDDFAALLRDPTTRPLRPPTCDGRQSGPLHISPLGASQPTPNTYEQLELMRAAFDVTDNYLLLLQPIEGHDGGITDFLIIDINQAACGYMQQEREAIVGQSLLSIFPQMEHNGLLDLYIDAAGRSTPTRISEFAYTYHDLFQDSRSYDIEILPIKGYIICTWQDVTDRTQAARTLGDTAALYRLLTDNIVEVVLLLNLQEEVVWVSPSLQPMTGWQEDQWIGRHFADLFSVVEGRPEPVHLADWLAPHGTIGQGRLRLADPQGGWSWVDLSVRQLNRQGLRSGDLSPGDPDGTPASIDLQEGYVITLQPVDQRVQEERRLLERANTDTLTGLMSRSAILSRLDHRLGDGPIRTAQPIALLFCDCDDFKGINDTYGHACGDAVLQAIAQRIHSVIRQQDHAGRIGGDEFLVLLDGVVSIEAAIAVAEKVQQAISQPIPWADRSISPSFSIGAAIHGAGEDAALFLKRADRNMYAAKKAGRHRVVAL